jgi:hypothetical protein
VYSFFRTSQFLSGHEKPLRQTPLFIRARFRKVITSKQFYGSAGTAIQMPLLQLFLLLLFCSSPLQHIKYHGFASIPRVYLLNIMLRVCY